MEFLATVLVHLKKKWFHLFIIVTNFWLCHEACGNLVPRQGIKPVPPMVEAQSLNHWRSRKIQSTTSDLLNIKTIFFPENCTSTKLLWLILTSKHLELRFFFSFYLSHQIANIQYIRDQIVNIHWIIKKAREFQKNIYSALLTMPKPLTVWITINWKILKEMGIPDHLTCLLRNLYAGQEATVRTGHGTTAWFQIRKGVHQGCILSPCLFNLYAEYIMRNAGLDEAQAGIKIAGRNINHLRYTDNTTLMAESEELKNLLMKVKEESEKVGLELNIQ